MRYFIIRNHHLFEALKFTSGHYQSVLLNVETSKAKIMCNYKKKLHPLGMRNCFITIAILIFFQIFLQSTEHHQFYTKKVNSVKEPFPFRMFSTRRSMYLVSTVHPQEQKKTCSFYCNFLNASVNKQITPNCNKVSNGHLTTVFAFCTVLGNPGLLIGTIRHI